MQSLRNEFDTPRLTDEQPMHGSYPDEARLIHRRRRQKLKRRLTAFGILSFTVVCGMLYQQATLDSALENKLKERERLSMELRALKKEEQGLEYEIERLQDPDYIAKIARRDYYLSKKGEIIFQINNKEKDNEPLQ